MEQTDFMAAAAEYQDMIYRVALHQTASPQDAEDAAQETMLRLWRAEVSFTGEEHLRYWLARVAVNVCRDMSRSPWRTRTVALEHCPEPSFTDPGQSALYEAVRALPAKYRLPLYLYYYEGYSAAEVGELLGLKVSTVQTRLARGRAKLKTLLGGTEYEQSV